MIYGATGSVDLQVVADAAARQGADNLVPVFGLVFLVVGLSFAGRGAFPYVVAGCLPKVRHFGDPVHRLGPKLAAFALIMRVLVDGWVRCRAIGGRC